jgi:hypothetical protein
VVGHGVAYDLRTLPTLVAVDAAGSVLGALAYHVGGDVLEVVSVASSGQLATRTDLAAGAAGEGGAARGVCDLLAGPRRAIGVVDQ